VTRWAWSAGGDEYTGPFDSREAALEAARLESLAWSDHDRVKVWLGEVVDVDPVEAIARAPGMDPHGLIETAEDGLDEGVFDGAVLRLEWPEDLRLEEVGELDPRELGRAAGEDLRDHLRQWARRWVHSSAWYVENEQEVEVVLRP